MGPYDKHSSNNMVGYLASREGVWPMNKAGTWTIVKGAWTVLRHKMIIPQFTSMVTRDKFGGIVLIHLTIGAK
jgi:hypothetical protein